MIGREEFITISRWSGNGTWIWQSVGNFVICDIAITKEKGRQADMYSKKENGPIVIFFAGPGPLKRTMT